MSAPVVLIAAVGRNGAIGRDGGLPWRLPGDLRHFRARTLGKPVVMGRATFASIGRPLPGRHVVVLSRHPEALQLPAGVSAAGTLEGALDRARAIAAERGAAEVMVAGGAAVYREALARADALCITEVDLEPEADTFFPAIDPARWREASRERPAPGPGDDSAYSFVEWRRLG